MGERDDGGATHGPARADRERLLQELQGVDWGEPDYPSHLVITCHRLHRTPLRDFEVVDLRMMIG